MSSLEKYILTDFKPHVQLEFKFKISSILHGADACPSKQQQAKAKADVDLKLQLRGSMHYLKSTFVIVE